MTRADEEAWKRMVTRQSNRLTDLLEVLRRWEPDYASAEDQRLILFAREARDDGRSMVAGKPCEGPCLNEQRRDKVLEGRQ